MQCTKQKVAHAIDGFDDINEIRDIAASANMGFWRIDFTDGEAPRMYVDSTVKKLIGLDDDSMYTPKDTYLDWLSKLTFESLPGIYKCIERMKQGHFDEITFLLKHPTKGFHYVRCGGTSVEIENGYILSGYFFDVDDIVRKEQRQANELKAAINDRDEYCATLETLDGIIKSLHIMDLADAVLC